MKVVLYSKTKDGSYIKLEHFLWKQEYDVTELQRLLPYIVNHKNIDKIVVKNTSKNK